MFLRRLDEDGKLRVQATKKIHQHVAILFGGAPLALLAIVVLHTPEFGWIRSLALVAAGGMWLLSLWFYSGFATLKGSSGN
jgi:hypothetical protein